MTDENLPEITFPWRHQDEKEVRVTVIRVRVSGLTPRTDPRNGVASDTTRDFEARVPWSWRPGDEEDAAVRALLARVEEGSTADAERITRAVEWYFWARDWAGAGSSAALPAGPSVAAEEPRSGAGPS